MYKLQKKWKAQQALPRAGVFRAACHISFAFASFRDSADVWPVLHHPDQDPDGSSAGETVFVLC